MLRLPRRQGAALVAAGRGPIVDELPHTATGKLLKTRLRETLRDAGGGASEPAVDDRLPRRAALLGAAATAT